MVTGYNSCPYPLVVSVYFNVICNGIYLIRFYLINPCVVEGFTTEILQDNFKGYTRFHYLVMKPLYWTLFYVCSDMLWNCYELFVVLELWMTY